MSNSEALPTTEPVPPTATETLVPDLRSQMTPAEMAERRMHEVLGEAPLADCQVARPVHGRKAQASEAGLVKS